MAEEGVNDPNESHEEFMMESEMTDLEVEDLIRRLNNDEGRDFFELRNTDTRDTHPETIKYYKGILPKIIGHPRFGEYVGLDEKIDEVLERSGVERSSTFFNSRFRTPGGQGYIPEYREVYDKRFEVQKAIIDDIGDKVGRWQKPRRNMFDAAYHLSKMRENIITAEYEIT